MSQLISVNKLNLEAVSIDNKAGIYHVSAALVLILFLLWTFCNIIFIHMSATWMPCDKQVECK